MELTPFVPDADWIRQHDERIARMLIPNPWNDPMIKKVGLYEMYIIDAIGEALEISAEEDAATKLGCMSAQYKKMHTLISEFLDSLSPEGFLQIVSFAEAHLKRRLNLVAWQVKEKDLTCWPDIRVLDTPDECFSWLGRLV